MLSVSALGDSIEEAQQTAYKVCPSASSCSVTVSSKDLVLSAACQAAVQLVMLPAGPTGPWCRRLWMQFAGRMDSAEETLVGGQ